MSQWESLLARFAPFVVPTAVMLWGLTAMAALLLCARAVAGAFDEPVNGLIPCLTATVALVATLGAWQLCTRAADSLTPMQRLGIGLSSLASPCVIGYSTSVQASPMSLGVTTGVLLIGLVVVIFDASMRVSIEMTALPVGNSNSDATPMGTMPMSQLTAEERREPADEIVDQSERPADLSHFTQRLMRTRDTEGGETIEATLDAVCGVGEKVVALHLPIHPVLTGTLEVECEPLDDSDVTVAITTVQPYGIRIEVRRSSRLDEELTVPVGISIIASGLFVNVA